MTLTIDPGRRAVGMYLAVTAAWFAVCCLGQGMSTLSRDVYANGHWVSDGDTRFYWSAVLVAFCIGEAVACLSFTAYLLLTAPDPKTKTLR